MNNPKYSESENVACQSVNDKYVLILHNDDYNSFDFVVDTLINVCEHNPMQAEQCTMIAHYKGKCDILSGDFNRIKSASHRMADAGLSVSIENFS